MLSVYKERIGANHEITEICQHICRDFKLGNFLDYKVTLVGYEDFNFALDTNKGRYFVKIFNKDRTDEECHRIVGVLEKALEARVSTPKLFKSNQGRLYQQNKLRICVMQYISGKDIFSLQTELGKDDIRYLAKQASLINSIDIKPKPIYDSWAITNFPSEFKQKGDKLKPEDLRLVKPLLSAYRNLRIRTLPHCFVHGDIIKTNVMKDEKGKLWIIDFSCANYYPRIQELAVLACDLFFDKNSSEQSNNNLEIALKEYQKIVKLTDRELNSLPAYIKLAHAMHLLRANYEKVANGTTSRENEYYLQLGRAGLRRS